MIEESALNLIGNYGFPIFMVIWFMVRTEKIITKNSQAIEHLSDNLQALIIRGKKIDF